ncbi:MAG: butyrate kinase [Bacteroidales bacterium]|nr:butyrate kinase [Bacteroidales bacterium]
MTQSKNLTGRVLAINTGSTSTKVGYYRDGEVVFTKTLRHSTEELSRFNDIMEEDVLRREVVGKFLRDNGIHSKDIDIVMAQSGLFQPCRTGVYRVNGDMRDVLMSCRDGRHACNLSAIIADNIAEHINIIRSRYDIPAPFGPCCAYVADPPMADEMLPECRIGGLPEFPRRAFFHALNSRATVRTWLREHGHENNDATAIVAHMGGGVTVTLHRNGEVIDTNNGLGGDGPFTPERAGSCPAFPLIDMCFNSGMSEEEVKKRVLGKGGAVAFFGTNDLAAIVAKAEAGQKDYATWVEAFALNVAKYIASLAATVEGKVDVILLTGGTAFSPQICGKISRKVSFIAPVEIYPGEKEMDALAEYGYKVLHKAIPVRNYIKDRLEEE